MKKLVVSALVTIPPHLEDYADVTTSLLKKLSLDNQKPALLPQLESIEVYSGQSRIGAKGRSESQGQGTTYLAPWFILTTLLVNMRIAPSSSLKTVVFINETYGIEPGLGCLHVRARSMPYPLLSGATDYRGLIASALLPLTSLTDLRIDFIEKDDSDRAVNFHRGFHALMRKCPSLEVLKLGNEALNLPMTADFIMRVMDPNLIGGVVASHALKTLHIHGPTWPDSATIPFFRSRRDTLEDVKLTGLSSSWINWQISVEDLLQEGATPVYFNKLKRFHIRDEEEGGYDGRSADIADYLRGEQLENPMEYTTDEGSNDYLYDGNEIDAGDDWRSFD